MLITNILLELRLLIKKNSISILSLCVSLTLSLSLYGKNIILSNVSENRYLEYPSYADHEYPIRIAIANKKNFDFYSVSLCLSNSLSLCMVKISYCPMSVKIDI